MQLFKLYRDRDLTGYSGTGVVAEGIVYSDGHVSMRWCVDGKPRTTTEADCLAHIAEIHGHDGATRVVMLADLADADDGAAR